MNNRCFASISALAAMGVVLLLTPGSGAGQASSPIAKAITAKTSTAVASYGINFIDKNYARSLSRSSR